jgi:hypothetical protein
VVVQPPCEAQMANHKSPVMNSYIHSFIRTQLMILRVQIQA